MQRFGQRWLRLLSAAGPIAAVAATAPPSPEAGAELGFGYDSNPARSTDGPGLAFVRVAFDAARTVPFGTAELQGGADGDLAVHTGAGGPGTAAGNAQGGLAVRRPDRLSGLTLDVTHEGTPRAAATLSVAAARCDSPTPVDAYARLGLGLLVRTELGETWPLALGLGWSRTRYDRAPRQLERVDTAVTAGLWLRHTLGPAEASCGLNWVQSDSTAPGRSFRQQVSRCGLAWSF